MYKKLKILVQWPKCITMLYNFDKYGYKKSTKKKICYIKT